MTASADTKSLPFGPVQMLVLAFDRVNFDGQIMPELERLKDAGIIRLLDLMFVTKRDGEIETTHASDLSQDEAEDFGAIVGALIGVGAGKDLEESMVAGAAATADGHLIDEDDVWYLADAIPDDSSAAVALIEHRWAIPLRDKLIEADGVTLADEWVHPADLMAVGARVAVGADSN
jgi:uncharacterized membrane protein